MIPHEYIEELNRRTDIVDLVGSYVQLKRKGRLYGGLCPFHSEKTPSFYVYPDTQSFYCFGCGAGGDAVTFTKKINSIDYVEAVKLLAQRAGMPEPTEDDKTGRLRSRILTMNKDAARFFHACLNSTVEEARQARAYWRRRGLDDKTINRFGLGYAPDDGQALYQHLRDKGYNQQELDASGLFKRSQSGRIYCLFWRRVMTPIFDLRGNIIAFGGRVLDDSKPKYLNSPETSIFHKGRNLFALNLARKTKNDYFILAEGYMDVIAVNQAGFTNAVATLGTALTGEQAVLMKRYADEVIICYDADEAGQKATARAIPILRNSGLNVKVLTIPSGKDPDEFIKSKGNDGPAAFKALLDKCGNDVEYRLQKLKNAHNIQLTEGKVAFLEEAAKLIATISSPIERDVYSSKVASELGVDKNAFKQQVSRVSRRGERAEEKKQARQIQLELSRRNDKINPEHFQKPRNSSAEEALLVYLLNNPDAYEEISARVKPEQFQNTLMRRFFEYFSARIERGEDPLTNTAADFTQDENSKLYQLMSQAIPGASTAEAMNEYINVINEESSKLNSGDLADVSNEELMAYLDKIRKKKQ